MGFVESIDKQGNRQEITNFRETQSWQGIHKKTFSTVSTNSDCYVRFEVGKTYLLYLHDRGKSVVHHIGPGVCGQTKPIDEATEDIEIL